MSRDPFPEIPRHQKKAPKKKSFGIEMYYPTGWFIHRWYSTKKARDQAFDGLKKSVCTALRQRERYRKVDR